MEQGSYYEATRSPFGLNACYITTRTHLPHIPTPKVHGPPGMVFASTPDGSYQTLDSAPHLVCGERETRVRGWDVEEADRNLALHLVSRRCKVIIVIGLNQET